MRCNVSILEDIEHINPVPSGNVLKSSMQYVGGPLTA